VISFDHAEKILPYLTSNSVLAPEFGWNFYIRKDNALRKATVIDLAQLGLGSDQ